MLEIGHVDTFSPEPDSLGLQQEALLKSELSRQGNTASGSQHTLPRKVRNGLKYFRNMAGAPRIARSLRYGPVGTHLAAGDLADGRRNGLGERAWVRRTSWHDSR